MSKKVKKLQERLDKLEASMLAMAMVQKATVDGLGMLTDTVIDSAVGETMKPSSGESFEVEETLTMKDILFMMLGSTHAQPGKGE